MTSDTDNNSVKWPALKTIDMGEASVRECFLDLCHHDGCLFCGSVLFDDVLLESLLEIQSNIAIMQNNCA